MKTLIYQNVNGLEESKRFMNQVQNLLPEGVEELYISSFGMEWAGTGTYRFVLELRINDWETISITKKTHDSITYDWYTDAELNRTYSNFAKRNILSLIEWDWAQEKIIEAIERINEEKAENE